MTGILAFGAYVPQKRLQRSAAVAATSWFNPGLAAHAKGERALAGWDEDSITMAVEAARDCCLEYDRSKLARISLASTSHPYADRQNSGVVKEALGIDDAIGTLDVGGSQRAGTSGLIAAFDSGAHAPVLCIASEKRSARPASEAELVNGDAAVGFVVGEGEALADFVGSYSVATDFVDHVRASARAHDFEWETRWIRDEGYLKIVPKAIGEALAKFGLDASSISHFIMPAPVRGINAAVAKAAGITPEAVDDALQAELGYTGAAHPLLMLAKRLETAEVGALIAVVSFGQGCDIILLRATGRRQLQALGVSGWLKRRRPDSNYVRHLYLAGELALDAGMRGDIELNTPFSMLYRDRKSLLSLVGGRCRETGVVQFPKSTISVAQNARMIDTQDDYPLADLSARVVTFTADRLVFTPDPPGCYGMVEFEGGGRLVADFTDVDDEGMTVGQPVRMMFRIKRNEQRRGFKHYFWKAAPDYRPD